MRLAMKNNRRFIKSLSSIALAAATLAGVLGATIIPEAQQFKDLQTPKSPLVLKAQGSFYVGGEAVEQTQAELGRRTISAHGAGGVVEAERPRPEHGPAHAKPHVQDPV